MNKCLEVNGNHFKHLLKLLNLLHLEYDNFWIKTQLLQVILRVFFCQSICIIINNTFNKKYIKAIYL